MQLVGLFSSPSFSQALMPGQSLGSGKKAKAHLTQLIFRKFFFLDHFETTDPQLLSHTCAKYSHIGDIAV